MKRPDIVNDLIAIDSVPVSVPLGPSTNVAVVLSTVFAVEVRALSIFLSATAGAAGLDVYIRRVAGQDVHLYRSPAAIATPVDEIVPLYNPILLARGDSFLILHGGIVTVSNPCYARYNGLIIPD